MDKKINEKQKLTELAIKKGEESLKLMELENKRREMQRDLSKQELLQTLEV